MVLLRQSRPAGRIHTKEASSRLARIPEMRVFTKMVSSFIVLGNHTSRTHRTYIDDSVYCFRQWRCQCSTFPCTGAQTAYLLYASDNNQNFKISRLDTNYYNVTTQVAQLSCRLKFVLCAAPHIYEIGCTASTLESPGMIKRDGVRPRAHIDNITPDLVQLCLDVFSSSLAHKWLGSQS